MIYDYHYYYCSYYCYYCYYCYSIRFLDDSIVTEPFFCRTTRRRSPEMSCQNAAARCRSEVFWFPGRIDR